MICTNFPSLLIAIFMFSHSKLTTTFAGPGVSEETEYFDL